MRFSTVVVAVLLWFAVPSAHAEGAERIQPNRFSSREEALMAYGRLLKPLQNDPLTFQNVTVTDLEPGTHLRVQYRSGKAVPIEFGVRRSNHQDFLAAVLPASENGDVLLPLLTSPSWRGDETDVTVRIYGLASLQPDIRLIRLEDHASPFGRIAAFLRHPFAPEQFTFSSMSELAGYRVGGVSLTLILGIVLVAGAIALMVWRRSPAGVLCLILVFLLLYEARFLLDAVPAALRHATQWSAEQRYGHMGSTYRLAQELRSDIESRPGEALVLVCTNMHTPLKYLLHPISVVTPDTLAETPTHVVTSSVWDEAQELFLCGDTLRFTGSVLHLFSEGGAIVTAPRT